jgi:hypothetical protein
LFSPLWVIGTNGSGKDLFTTITRHFNSCSTYDFTQKGQIQSSLTKGQNGIFELVHKKYPTLFWYGEFASFDEFVGACLDPENNPPRQLKQLFTFMQTRSFSCPLGNNQPTCRGDIKGIFTLTIHRVMFLENDLPIHDVSSLVNEVD